MALELLGNLPDTTPLIALGDREIPGGFEDHTQEVWQSVQDDYLECGVSPDNPEFKYMQNVVKRAGKGSNRDQLIWYFAEVRARQSGGLFWFSRNILEWKRLIREVHDWHFMSYIEGSSGTPSKNFFQWHRTSFKSVCLRSAVIHTLGVQPQESIAFAQATDEDVAESMREIITTIEVKDRLRVLFPHLQPARSPVTKRLMQWGEDGIITKGKLKYADEGIGKDYSCKGLSGEKAPTGKHPTWVGVDDLLTLKNTRHVSSMIAPKEFFEDLIGPALQSDCPVHVIGTPYRVDDLYHDIKEGRFGDWHMTFMPLKRHVPEGTPGSVPDPVFEGRHCVYCVPKARVIQQLKPHMRRGTCGFDEVNDLEFYKRMGHVRYMAQMMLNPIPPGSIRFPENGWKEYDHENPVEVEVGEDPVEAKANFVDSLSIFASADIAIVAEAANDYTAMVVGGVSQHGKVYILDIFYDKVPPDVTLDALFQLWVPPSDDALEHWIKRPVHRRDEGLPEKALRTLECWQPEWIVMEKEVVTTTFRAAISEREDRENFIIPDYPAKGVSQAKKGDRILKGLQVPFKRGRIYHPKSLFKFSAIDRQIVDIVRRVRIEYVGFMQRGVPDDYMDCLKGLAPFFGDAYRPERMEQREEERPKGFIADIMGDILGEATGEDIIPGVIEEGDLIPKRLAQYGGAVIDFNPGND